MDKKPCAKWMCLAISEARRGMRRSHGGPFGAEIIYKGKALALSHNTVLKNSDPTCHAEVNAIREAARKLKTFDLSGCHIYSTTEPCPMCFAAIHWARIPSLVFGTSISEVKRLGFNELPISNAVMKKNGKIGVKITKKFMINECREILREWESMQEKRVY